MNYLTWSNSEKRLARSVFKSSLDAELGQIIAEFKVRAAAVDEPEEMWVIGEFLERRRREVEMKYDYRYSQLIHVFGRLLRERRINREQLQGLSPEKLDLIDRIASF